MNRRLQVLAAGLFCGLILIFIIGRIVSKGAPDGRAGAALAAPDPEPDGKGRTPRVEIPNVKPDAQTLERLKELEKMEKVKRQRDLAAEKTRQSRADIQRFRHRAWMEVIETYQPEFEILRAAAANSPSKKVPCAICGARGILDLCVVCDHTGKCPTCKGTGKADDGGVCPTCLGSGKCFLCRGSGKMDCPFCQSSPLMKEVITPATPDPLRDFPLPEVASPTPAGEKRPIVAPPPPGGSRPVTSIQ